MKLFVLMTCFISFNVGQGSWGQEMNYNLLRLMFFSFIQDEYFFTGTSNHCNVWIKGHKFM